MGWKLSSGPLASISVRDLPVRQAGGLSHMADAQTCATGAHIARNLAGAHHKPPAGRPAGRGELRARARTVPRRPADRGGAGGGGGGAAAARQRARLAAAGHDPRGERRRPPGPPGGCPPAPPPPATRSCSGLVGWHLLTACQADALRSSCCVCIDRHASPPTRSAHGCPVRPATQGDRGFITRLSRCVMARVHPPPPYTVTLCEPRRPLDTGRRPRLEARGARRQPLRCAALRSGAPAAAPAARQRRRVRAAARAAAVSAAGPACARSGRAGDRRVEPRAGGRAEQRRGAALHGRLVHQRAGPGPRARLPAPLARAPARAGRGARAGAAAPQQKTV